MSHAFFAHHLQAQKARTRTANEGRIGVREAERQAAIEKLRPVDGTQLQTVRSRVHIVE